MVDFLSFYIATTHAIPNIALRIIRKGNPTTFLSNFFCKKKFKFKKCAIDLKKYLNKTKIGKY